MSVQEPSLIDLILDCNDLEEFTYLKSINRYVFQNDYKYNNNNASFIIKYATFELDCTHNMSRFRHNMESVLNNNISTWLNYINMEIKYNNINHAHNLFLRYINKYLNDLNDLNTIFVYYLQFIYVTEMHKSMNILEFFNLWKTKLNQLASSQTSHADVTKYQNFYFKVCIKFLREFLNENDESLVKTYIDWFINTLSFDYWITFEQNKINQSKENRIVNVYKLRSIYQLIIDHLSTLDNNIKLKKVLVKYTNFEFGNEEHDIAKQSIQHWRSVQVDDEAWDKLLSNTDFTVEYEQFEKILKYFNVESDDGEPEIDELADKEYAFGVIGYESSHESSFRQAQLEEFEIMQSYFLENADEITYEQSLSYWSNYLRFIEEENDDVAFEDIIGVFNDFSLDEYTEKTNSVKIYLFIQRRYLKYSAVSDPENIADLWENLISNVKENETLRFKNVWLDYLSYIKSAEPENYESTLTDVIVNYGKPSLYNSLADSLYKENNFDMLRKVYNALIVYNPTLTSSWTKLFDLEILLQDSPRVRALTYKIIELFSSIANDESIEYINNIFKRSIDYETEDGEYAHVRYKLYHLYFQDSISKSAILTASVQNWVDYAYWEFKSPTDKQLELLEKEENEDEVELTITEDNILNARKVFELSLKHFKPDFAKRYQMYQQFITFETNYGKDEAFLKALKDRKPVNNTFPEDKIKNESEQDEEENKLDDLFSAVDNWES